jgi:hypothetical protein
MAGTRRLGAAGVGLIAAIAAISSVARAQDRGAVYQTIERRCEDLMRASPDDMASLANLRIPMPTMCQCIATAMAPKLLASEVASLAQSEKPPPRVDALWLASRGFCAVTLGPKP